MNQKERFGIRKSLLRGVMFYVLWAFLPMASCAEISGVGALLAKESGKIVVKVIITNSPAYYSNSIKPNDVIVAVAEEKGIQWKVANSTVPEVVEHLRGTEGTLVRITVIRKAAGIDSTLEFGVVRAKLEGLDEWGDGNWIPIGEKAPLIEARSLSLESPPVTISSKSNVVVLYFWATWCGPCIQSWEAREKFFDSHPQLSSGVEHWNISVDANISEVRKFFSKRTDLGSAKALWA